MKRFSLSLLAASSLAACWCAPAQAQLVQVGPGYVKAPFVRVYSGPNGSAVRAPFVDIQRGMRGPRIPSPDQLAQMDWRTLREVLTDMSEDLDDQLSGMPTGNSWKVFLRTAEIRVLADESDSPPSPDSIAQAQQILKTFEKTSANETYRNVAGLPGFQGTYRALAEFSSPPERRTRFQLAAAGADLSRQLERVGAEAGWQRHLALPESLASDSPRGDAASPEAMEKMLARYDAVSTSDQYRAIARLPAFQATHQRLSAYVGMMRGPTPGAPTPAEELPPPPAPR